MKTDFAGMELQEGNIVVVPTSEGNLAYASLKKIFKNGKVKVKAFYLDDNKVRSETATLSPVQVVQISPDFLNFDCPCVKAVMKACS